MEEYERKTTGKNIKVPLSKNEHIAAPDTMR